MLNQQKHPAEREVLGQDLVFFAPLAAFGADEGRFRTRLERESIFGNIDVPRLLRRRLIYV